MEQTYQIIQGTNISNYIKLYKEQTYQIMEYQWIQKTCAYFQYLRREIKWIMNEEKLNEL